MSLFDRFRRNKTPKKKPSANEHAPRHCFVLCKSAQAADPALASRAVSRVFGRGHSVDCSDPNIFVVQRGQDTVGFLAHMPVPIPGQEAQDNADGNFLWPEGKQEAAEHKSHVIVTTMHPGDQPPVEAALDLTRLALVALEIFDGLGVYWGNANVSHSRSVFEGFSKGMSPEHVPVPLWLRFQFVSGAGGEVGMYTLGMQQFNMMDLEVDRCKLSPEDLFEFISNIAHYLILSGPVIADGNTVGGDAEQQILVRHLPSMLDETKTVYKILFD
jgi:hypothetical protein